MRRHPYEARNLERRHVLLLTVKAPTRRTWACCVPPTSNASGVSRSTTAMSTISISGIAIPRLCFGVGTLMKWAPGHTHPLPTDSSVEIQQAIDAGFRHFNTGDIYTNNDSFAEVLRRSNLKRSEIFLSLKINTYASLGCRGRDHMIQAVKQEIERFGILEGYVDILQLHFPPRGYDGNMTNRDAWHVLEDLKDEGVARIIGVSNWYVVNNTTMGCNPIKAHERESVGPCPTTMTSSTPATSSTLHSSTNTSSILSCCLIPRSGNSASSKSSTTLSQ